MRRNNRLNNGSSFRTNNETLDKLENVADTGTDNLADILEQKIESDLSEAEITETIIDNPVLTTLDPTEMINNTTMEEDLDMSMNDKKEQKENAMENSNMEEDLLETDRNMIMINKDRYEILANEHADIFHPEYFGISPTWATDSNFQYKCIFELKDNQLYLKSFQVTSDRGYPVINQVKPEICSFNQGIETVQYSNVYEPLKYSGAIMFANNLIKDYRLVNHLDMYKPFCFSYKFVGELIFDEGKLITSVNHNKAMRRIRKNIDLGLRSLDKKQDIKCITKFIKASFIGDYQHKDKMNKRKWKENLNNNNMRNKEVHMMESGKKKYMDKVRQHIKKFGPK